MTTVETISEVSARAMVAIIGTDIAHHLTKRLECQSPMQALSLVAEEPQAPRLLTRLLEIISRIIGSSRFPHQPMIYNYETVTLSSF